MTMCLPGPRCLTLLALALSVASHRAGAQVIRGVVTERVSGVPLRGTLISVAIVPDSLQRGGIRHTLTNARGEYALRLASGGRYVLSAKRIGVARHSTDVFTLGAGETRRIDLALDRFEQRLPTVNVVDHNLCFRRNEQRGQILSLWDEVRTALVATGVSREEQLVSGVLSKYNRTLEPLSLRILEDRRTVFEGLFERPMRSISGDSLAKVGFWRAQDQDTLVFYGPDDVALLSTAFSGGHCFELVSGKDAPRGLIGLGFQPRRPNVKGGIDGTIWIDAGNFELRFVQFRYTNLITLPANPHLGGQVHYERHPSGAWLVRRWFIRMPLFTKAVTYRPTVWRVFEEGGGLYSPGLRSWEAPGTITGIVTDSTGQAPLRGTVVALSGTPLSAEVDSLGRFRFDSIPPGAYTLLASHSAYADFGQMADDEPLTLESGTEYQANLRAITTTQLRSMLCDVVRTEPPFGTTVTSTPDQSIVRILMSHADGSGIISGLPLWLRWRDPKQNEPTNDRIEPNLPQNLLGLQSITDNAGGATFCGLPAGISIELLMVITDNVAEGGREVRVSSFTLKRGEITVRSFNVRPPK
jgi:hypothetical protein